MILGAKWGLVIPESLDSGKRAMDEGAPNVMYDAAQQRVQYRKKTRRSKYQAIGINKLAKIRNLFLNRMEKNGAPLHTMNFERVF